jgi:hypothetical protein
MVMPCARKCCASKFEPWAYPKKESPDEVHDARKRIERLIVLQRKKGSDIDATEQEPAVKVARKVQV